MTTSANSTPLTELISFLSTLPRIELVQRLHGDPALRALSGSAERFDIDIPGLALSLKDFQTGGVQYILGARRVLLADQMRLGKTPTAIASLLAADTFPALVVCPPSLRKNWVREIAKFAPALRVARLDGQKPTALPTADVFVIGDATVAYWEPKLLTAGLQAIVVDESHRFKNYKAKRTGAVIRIAATVDRNTGLRLCMSGTPIVNRPAELISQLDILGRTQELFGNMQAFLNRHCAPTPVWNGVKEIMTYPGAENLEELNEILTGTCMVRRTRKQVFDMLPEQRIDVPLDINGKLATYKRAEADFIRFLVELGDPKAVAAARRAEAIVHMTALRKLAVEAKLDAIIEYVSNIVAQDEQVVVFGWHRDPLLALVAKLESEGIETVTILGGSKDPQASADAFQSGKAKVIVGNIDSMGVGFTLDKATNIVFVEQAWTPGQMEQAASRCSSLFQTGQVYLHYLLAADTIDEMLNEVLRTKQAIADAVIDGNFDAQDEGSVQDAVLDMLMIGR